MNENMFNDDQHQPMSDWMESLAAQESGNLGTDDVEEILPVKKSASYNGIQSTWENRPSIERSFNQTVDLRVLKNKEKIAASDAELNLEARSLLFKRASLDEMKEGLLKKFSSKEVEDFLSKHSNDIQKEFGRLGYIYADASLSKDSTCDDIKTAVSYYNGISDLGMTQIKKASKCEGCILNKKNHCLKMGMNLVDIPTVNTANEAKRIMKRFASLKYIDGAFLRQEDLQPYFVRLASENPEDVLSSFLKDITTRKVAATNEIKNKIIASDTTKDPNDIAVIPKMTFKEGKDDREVENFIKEKILHLGDLKSAQKEAEDKFGKDRVKSYLKEAKDVIKGFEKFLNKKADGPTVDLVKNQNVVTTELKNKQSSSQIEMAKQALYDALSKGIREQSAHQSLVKAYGPDLAKTAMNIHANDIAEHKLGYLYTKLNKEGSTFTADSKIDTQREANRILAFAQKINFADNQEISKIQSKLKPKGNANMIRAFLTTTQPKKKMSSDNVEKIVNIALKYASQDKRTEIKTFLKDSWTTPSQLVSVLNDRVMIQNKKAFKEDLENSFFKSANDAGIILKRTQQFLNENEKRDEGFDFPLYNVF